MRCPLAQTSGHMRSVLLRTASRASRLASFTSNLVRAFALNSSSAFLEPSSHCHRRTPGSQPTRFRWACNNLAISAGSICGAGGLGAVWAGASAASSLGFGLDGAFGLYDLELGLRDRLALGYFDLLSGGFCLLLRHSRLGASLRPAPSWPVPRSAAGLLEFPLRLIGELLLGLRGLARALLFQLLAEFRSLLRSFALCLSAFVVGLHDSCGRQLCVLSSGKIGIEAGRMPSEKRSHASLVPTCAASS